jgi:hypothetical protein
VVDHDFSSAVNGHSKWKLALPEVFRHVTNHGLGL